MGKLTAKRVEGLVKPGRSSDDDGSGFHLQIDAKGRKSWVLRTRVSGKTKDISLGSAKRLTLAAAREKSRIGTTNHVRRAHALRFTLLQLLTAALSLAVSTAPARAGPAEEARASAWFAQHRESPEDYVVRQFRAADVVLIGEDHAVHQNLTFTQALIPKLYRAGIYTLGMEFGAAEDQAALDALIRAPDYDEAAARRILFGYDTGWAYRDYEEIYRAAWALNHALPSGARRFRILNLSYRFDWSRAGPVMTPARAAAIFRQGPVDAFRAALIRRQVLARGDKMLALVGTLHAVTRFHWPVYDYNRTGFVRRDAAHLGNLLLAMRPGRVKTVLLHQPFYDRVDGPARLVAPAGGAIERIVRGRAGFDLAGTPMGALPDTSLLATPASSIPLAAIADGYIVLAPFDQLRGSSVDRAFVTTTNWAEARARFPRELRPVPTTLAEYWTLVEAYADVQVRYRDVR